jgi:hypothetical protein
VGRTLVEVVGEVRSVDPVAVSEARGVDPATVGEAVSDAW